MTKTTTNLLGIIITILAGTYFFVMYCSECNGMAEEASTNEIVESKNNTRSGDSSIETNGIKKEEPKNDSAEISFN